MPDRDAPEVTVLIPMLNAADTVASQLDALVRQDFSGTWEMVVADNGATDGGVETVRQWADRIPALRVVDASQKKGVSYARNVGARAARGEVILVCDADDVVSPCWLASLAAAAYHSDLVGGKIDVERLNDPIVRSWWTSQPDDDLPVSQGFLRYAVGANCGVRASVWRALGGWNEDYIGGGNDVEFCWRAQLAGYRLNYVPEAVVYKRLPQRLRDLASKSYRSNRAAARLCRDFRDALPETPKPQSGVTRVGLQLLLNLPGLLVSRKQRGIWVRWAAAAAGYLVGRLQCRAPAYLVSQPRSRSDAPPAGRE